MDAQKFDQGLIIRSVYILITIVLLICVSILVIVKHQYSKQLELEGVASGYHLAMSRNALAISDEIYEFRLWLKNIQIKEYDRHKILTLPTENEIEGRLYNFTYKVDSYIKEMVDIEHKFSTFLPFLGTETLNRKYVATTDRLLAIIREGTPNAKKLDDALLPIIAVVNQIQRTHLYEHKKLQNFIISAQGRHFFTLIISVSALLAMGAFLAIKLVRFINSALLAQQQTSLALRASEEHVRLLLNSTGEAIYGVDLEGNCTFVNPACAKILGYTTTEELLGRDMHLLMHSTGASSSPPSREQCLICRCHRDNKNTHSQNEEFLRIDGSTFPVEIWGHPIWRDGKVIGSVVTFIDITERKKSEEAIRRLNGELEERVKQRTEQLQAANKQLSESLQQLRNAQHHLVQSEKMAALGGLVAGVAHEINTPIGVCVTSASYLDTKVKRYVELYNNNQLTRSDFEKLLAISTESSGIILSNMKRASELVQSFKEVAVDQAESRWRQFNVKEYINEIITSLRPKLKNTHHQIKISIPEQLVVYSHPGAFSQIITNLVINSLIHGFEDIEAGEICITAHQMDDRLEIVYSDDGKGIAAGNVNRVFEPFFTTKRNQGGSGLGMHIIYNLVTQTLNGTVECTSEYGQGVRFVINVPYRADPLRP